jgi:DNA primase large subunit
MIRSEVQRADVKRRRINEKKRQFTEAAYDHQDYPHRLNFYEVPPTSEICLEDFEKWAIDRLRSESIAPS